MINGINHWALNSVPGVHDEEALTTLQLVARVTQKINEVVSTINDNTSKLEGALTELPDSILEAVTSTLKSDNVNTYLSTEVLKSLSVDLDTLNNRINNILSQTSEDITELVDARTSIKGVTYGVLRDHLIAIENGYAFSDAVRPGTVKAGRIMAGMLGGAIRDQLTRREIIPMAGHWNDTGYYDPTTLEKTAHTGYYMGDLIPVEYGEVYLVTSYIYGPSVKPVALLDENKNVLSLEGAAGDSTWDVSTSEVHISTSLVKYIQFLCGTSYVQSFTAYKFVPHPYGDREQELMSKDHMHVYAKRRTDTVTDRAQLRVWFELPIDRTEDTLFHIPIHLTKWYNLAGYTFRLFGAVSNSTYDVQLSTSASGYTFGTGYGIHPYFKIPLQTDGGESITHLCLFIDLLPANTDDYMNVWAPALAIHENTGSDENTYPGEGYSLHGGLDTDHMSVVYAGAAGRRLYGKSVLGIGDSLMKADGLKQSQSWFDLMAGHFGMYWHNAAVNGLAVGGSGGMAANVESYLDQHETVTGSVPDFVIVEGGANDLRLSVSLSDFTAGLETIVNAVRDRNPRAHIMFATNWRRSEYVNTLGLSEEDYVTEMLRKGEELCIPTLNNYCGGINLKNPYTQQWADNGVVNGGEPDLHFSIAANIEIADTVAIFLEGV